MERSTVKEVEFLYCWIILRFVYIEKRALYTNFKKNLTTETRPPERSSSPQNNPLKWLLLSRKM